MKEKQIISTIEAFGFKQNPRNAYIYSKAYDNIKYKMSVDFTKKYIDYGVRIKKGNETKNIVHTAISCIYGS